MKHEAEHTIQIKGQVFGNGEPVICVPVVDRNAESICETIQTMTAQRVQMIEWRMDWYEEVSDREAVKQLLAKIKPYVTDTVLLCTFRSKKQGGELPITEEEYLALNLAVAETGVADLIDLEYYELDEPREIIRQLQENGVGVVCSNHNFQQTPETAEMQRQLMEMAEAGADFAKLAVMPKKKTDVLRLMEAVLAVKESCPKYHLIAMSMDKAGVISRLLGGWYHSEVTFAAFSKASAPGQVSYEKVQEIINQMKEYISQ